MKKYLTSFAILVAVAVQAATAPAQSTKPVAAFSLSGYGELVNDVDFLGSLAGQPGAGQTLDAMVKMTTQGQGLKGLDKEKPWGVVVTTDGSDFQPLIFLPVSDVKGFVEVLRQPLASANMAPNEEEPGVYSMTLPNGDDVFLRGQGEWLFVSRSKDDALPEDPIKLLEGLDKEYDFGIRAFVQNIPEPSKEMALSQLRSLLDLAAMAQQDDEDAAELTRKSVDLQMKQVERLLNEADQVTIGLKVDNQAKNVFLDMTFTAKPGTSLDNEMQLMAEAKTDYAGFTMPGAGFTMNVAGRSSPETIENNLIALQRMHQQAERAIEEDDKLTDDAARDQVKAVLNQLMDVAKKTIKTGKMDGGVVVMLGDQKLQLAAGAYVDDGPSLEAALKNFIELAKGEPDFNQHATVNMNADKVAGIDVHQVNVNLPDEDAQKVFGETLQIYFGTGPNSAYFALGQDSLDLLKKAIEASAAEAGKNVMPLEMSVSLAAVFTFIESIDDSGSTAALSDELDKVKGKDHILITAKPISNGITYRFEVEEGILKAVAAMSKSVGGGLGAGPGGF